MPVEIRFRRIYPWAIPPYRARTDAARARDIAQLYRAHFRWARADRVKELCWPARLGVELGWVVPSPVDIEFTELQQVEVTGDDDETHQVAQLTGLHEVWRRDRTALAIRRTPWLHLYQFGSADSGWRNMFLPNGEDTIEWHLGIGVEIPSDYFLLTMPASCHPDLDVPLGVLDGKVTGRMNAGPGLAIAVRPRANVPVKRGDPIARLILLHADSINAKAVVSEGSEESGPEGTAPPKESPRDST